MEWQIKSQIKSSNLAVFPELDPIVLQLLFNRGLTDRKRIDDFLSSSYEDNLYDPFLFKDMAKAVERLFLAVSRAEKIMIYGDYDADGVCSTAILFETIKGLGGEADIYIPFREGEGYGLNTKIVQQIISQRFNLLITVDCGVANHQEIQMLQEAGIEVIVLDHHEEPLQLPVAFALINPNVKSCGYPESRLCGAGVAFKFLQAIMKWQETHDTPIKLPDGFEKWLLDLAAIATVGDIVPLVGENRVLVKYGLLVLAKTKNEGLKKLIEKINYKNNDYDSEYLGWRIVPRLNAAGRINHASAAFYLLTSKEPEEIEKWVSMLEENNKFRQQLTVKILAEAEAQISGSQGGQKAIIISGVDWPAGILGLVAGRLCDKYHQPTLVFSQDGDHQASGVASKYVASGRSIEEFDITEALKACDQYLSRYGGHPQACGLTVIGEENFRMFRAKFLALAEEKLRNIKLEKKLAVDLELKLSQINWRTVDEIEKFEPFGEANEKPIFVARDLHIEQIQTVGADGKHLKVLVSQDNDLNNLHKLIGFSFGDWCARLKVGDQIDIAFELGVNEWNGNRELQLKIVDLKLSE